MITTTNFKQLLELVGFKQLMGREENVWHRAFTSCELRVDFNVEKLIYPEDKGFTVNERTTCNFAAPENFVVFECVCRLLAKGYKPEHIEIEHRWSVRSDASGSGRADIIVRNNDKRAFLIIECKKYDEFNKYYKKLMFDGGQLFDYYHQEPSTQYLCLYTSGIIDDKLKPDYRVVAVRDNEEYLKTLKNPKKFSEALNREERFSVWRDTYGQDLHKQGIFEEQYAAYDIDKPKLTASDLQVVYPDDIQKKYHEFATILRQHNVSGRENAFDKLVNLFLAKITDETQNKNELMFYWHGVAFDNYYDLQDRIQRLYRDGMQKFLDEEVTYIDNEKIKEAFRLFKNDPDATRTQIEEYFNQLKFYTNNDFAFLDVHNKSLFFQNSAILIRIVNMLQDIRLKSKEQDQNQLLGDLFEGFLDQGIKQSEGQFFTPTPIVKFLVSSLPLQSLIKKNAEPLRVIDYACGAGHFINDYAKQIQEFLVSERLADYYKSIVGVEKEYRLSKVAKVSAFMYGQDEIQIIYADALGKNSNIKDGSFNVLISNPPYSVKGFLETLTEEERAAFEMTKVIDKKGIITNKSIEVFFVERAKQLLAPGGVAAIILPSSLLSNSGAVYTKVREIILQYFDIVAIAEFGSSTFGKTGTNTVTMFLRRKAESPSFAEHYLNRVNAWFGGDFEKDGVFEDRNLLFEYCSHVGFNCDDYMTLLSCAPNEKLMASDTFATYKTAFEGLTKTKNRRKQKTFQQLPDDQKESEMKKRLLEYIQIIEKDKLYYFMLAFDDHKKILVIKSPSEKTEQKNFLGYGWSTRKGQEGIRYVGISVEESKNDDINDKILNESLARLKGIRSINTPLFNPDNLSDTSKINSIIRHNFDGVILGENEFINNYRLVDMLDFSGVKFEKQINLTAEKTATISSKWSLVFLSNVCTIISGGTPNTANPSFWGGDIPWLSVADFSKVNRFVSSAEKSITKAGLNNSNTNVLEPNDIIISARGTVGAIAQLLKPMAFNQSCYGLKANEHIESGYLFYALKCVVHNLRESATGSKFKAITTADLQTLKIPLPPLDVQREIVTACEVVDKEYENTRMNIDEYRQKIEQLFSDMEIITGGGYNLGDKRLFSLSIGKRVLDTQLVLDGEVPVYSANVFEPFGYINERLITDFSIPSVLWGIDGDWQVSYISAEREFYPTDHCGVLRVLTDEINPRCLTWALEKAGKERGFTRTLRASIDRVERLTVKLPSIEKQREVAEKVFELEALIEIAKATLIDLDSKRKSILEGYLFRK